MPEAEEIEPEEGDKHSLLFCHFGSSHRLLDYKDIADPICDFIWNEHGEYHRDRKKLLAPLQSCKKPGCEKLVAAERPSRKKFCSDTCRALNKQESNPSMQNSDSAFICRTKKLSTTALRDYLREDNSRKERLRRIRHEYSEHKPTLTFEADKLLKRAG